MTDVSIRAAMAITVIVAIANATLFYGWISGMWWLFGALPFGLLTAVAFYVGHALGDPHRGGLACTLVMAALAWPLALLLAPALVGLALVVTAAPRNRWIRALLVVPATVAVLAIAVLTHPWSASSASAGWTYGIAIGHVLVLAIPTLLFCRGSAVTP